MRKAFKGSSDGQYATPKVRRGIWFFWMASVGTHLALRRLQEKIERQDPELEQEIVRSKQAEEKVNQITDEWEATFDSISDLVSIHDRDFTVIRVNRAFSEALGMPSEKLVGKKCYELIHGTGDPRGTCPHARALEIISSSSLLLLLPWVHSFLPLRSVTHFTLPPYLMIW